MDNTLWDPFFWWSLMMIAYYVVVGGIVTDGYFRALIGHSHGSGHSHSKLHIVLWQIHTGMHVNPNRSYGDESRLKRAAGASNRATPEGAIVYFTKWKRLHRAIRNNAIVWAFLGACFGLVLNAKVTVNLLAVALTLTIVALIGRKIYKARRRAMARPARVISSTRWDNLRVGRNAVPRIDAPLFEAGGVLTEAKPKLDGGVPPAVMAVLLSAAIGISPAETDTRLEIGADRGTLALPDTFPALPKQRENVEEIVRAQTKGTVSFAWNTSSVPRTVTWVPIIIAKLPDLVRFREWVAQMEALPPGVFGVGLTAERNMYETSHQGDKPWWLRSVGSGGGKSMGFKVKLAQICHQDPMAEVYCIDTKQVSFQCMHGIPGVHIYDDPVDHMGDIYGVWGVLAGIMRSRYTALRRREARREDFPNLWVLVDEGNDLGTCLKSYYTTNIKESGDPVQPPVWREYIEKLINQGREVGIRGEWMFQNMTDSALGGISLRDSWGGIAMGNYKKNQFGRIVGTTYVPPKEGPGRLLMVEGSRQTWVQGFCDDDQVLRDYALAGRR